MLSADLPWGLKPTHQIGLFAWGEAPVTFTDLRIEPQRPQVFVAYQFKGYDAVYEEIIASLGDEVTFLGGATSGPGSITAQIARDIADADVVIAEVTPTNGNVFFEVGYAMAVGKPVVLLAKEGRRLPFDLKVDRCIYYGAGDEAVAQARHELSEQVRVAVAGASADVGNQLGG